MNSSCLTLFYMIKVQNQHANIIGFMAVFTTPTKLLLVQLKKVSGPIEKLGAKFKPTNLHMKAFSF